MKPVGIFGIGSPNGDDRAAWLAVDALKRLPHDQPCVIEAYDRPGVTLLDRLTHVRRAILIDAMVSGAEPGTVRRLERDELAMQPGLSSHGFGVAETLALGEKLGVLPEHLVIYGIELDPATLDGTAAHEHGLSEALSRRIDHLVALVNSEIVADRQIPC